MHYFEHAELTALLSAAHSRKRVHHMLFLACAAHGMRVSDALRECAARDQHRRLNVSVPT